MFSYLNILKSCFEIRLPFLHNYNFYLKKNPNNFNSNYLCINMQGMCVCVEPMYDDYNDHNNK